MTTGGCVFLTGTEIKKIRPEETAGRVREINELSFPGTKALATEPLRVRDEKTGGVMMMGGFNMHMTIEEKFRRCDFDNSA